MLQFGEIMKTNNLYMCKCEKFQAILMRANMGWNCTMSEPQSNSISTFYSGYYFCIMVCSLIHLGNPWMENSTCKRLRRRDGRHGTIKNKQRVFFGRQIIRGKGSSYLELHVVEQPCVAQ